MGVKIAVLILMCPLVATPYRDRVSEYYARPLGWGGGASHLDRGTYYSNSHRSGSSETHVSRGSHAAGYPGMIGTGMYGTGLGTGLGAGLGTGLGTGLYNGRYLGGISSLSSTRCIHTRAAKDTTACERNLENEVKKIPKGSPDYHKKVCCLAASADKCHERARRASGCESRAVTQTMRTRPWLLQYLGNQNCGTYDCGTTSVYRTGYSSAYGSPYGSTGYATGYGMGHGGYRYPYGYGAGASLRATWSTVSIVIVGCLLFTKYSS